MSTISLPKEKTPTAAEAALISAAQAERRRLMGFTKEELVRMLIEANELNKGNEYRSRQHNNSYLAMMRIQEICRKANEENQALFNNAMEAKYPGWKAAMQKGTT